MPYGFDSPRGERDVVRPEDKLAPVIKAFGEYLDGIKNPKINFGLDGVQSGEWYAYALEKIKGVDFSGLTDAEINLIAHYYTDHRKHATVGFFLSACYKAAGLDSVTVNINLDEDIPCIGFNFNGHIVNLGYGGNNFAFNAKGVVENKFHSSDKFGRGVEGVVVNKDKSLDNFGFLSSVAINDEEAGDFCGNSTTISINNGTVGNNASENSGGVAINVGNSGHDFANKASGLVIAIKEPLSYGDLSKAERVLKPEDCKRLPELTAYLDSINTLKGRLLATNDKHERDLLLGLLKAEKIQEDIYRIVDL